MDTNNKTNTLRPSGNSNEEGLSDYTYFYSDIKTTKKVTFGAVVCIPGIREMLIEYQNMHGIPDLVHTLIRKLAYGYDPIQLIDEAIEEDYYDLAPEGLCEVLHSRYTCAACDGVYLWEEFAYNVMANIVMYTQFTQTFADRILILKQTHRPFNVAVRLHAADQFIVEVTHDSF